MVAGAKTPRYWPFGSGDCFRYSATPTTALTAKIYGRYSVGELSGWIFFSHQLGSAFGSLVGGYLYDRFGDYTLAFHSAALMAFVATGLVLAIRERPGAGRPSEARLPIPSPVSS